MSGRRKSVDGGAYGGSSAKNKMQLALLKLSTANAFAKGLNALTTVKRVENSATSLPQDTPFAVASSGGSGFIPEDELGLGQLASFSSADCAVPISPQPRGPYYGMYAEYEDVMELLHSGIVADGSARRLLSQVNPGQVVHVAHLGIGACCSVDLVAVHCADGRRLLAAAKSCYLPPSDPRLRASLREAELLRRCTDCPFIMQLLALLQQDVVDQGSSTPTAAMTPGLTSPVAGTSPGGTPPQTSLQMAPSGLISMFSGNAAAAMAGFGVGGCSSGTCGFCMEGGMDSSVSAAASLASASDMMTMMACPGYQAWAQWRGGGAEEDLERQIMQRLLTATSGGVGGCEGGALDAAGGFCLGGMGSAGMGGMGVASSGLSRRGSLGGSVRNSLSGWEAGGGFGSGGSATTGTVDDGGANAAATAAYGYGGGWACGVGAVQGCGTAMPRERFRRSSMDIVDMYGGCLGPAKGAQGCGDAAAGAAVSGAAAAAPVELPIMCTLLIGWARCGDLRRLVQLLLSRSSAHQNNKQTGAAPGVYSLPPLVPEDAARFYMGCVVLALEHLHSRLRTVHRDLKLANLLLLDSGYALVGDLGTAVDLTTVPGGRLNSRVGSPGHMAPECRDRDETGYDTAADMWSLGACLFSLLTGQLPAGVAGPPNRQWTPPVSRHWSHELQELMGRLLAWSPSQRPNTAQLMRDPWFRHFNWNALREQRMQPPINTPWRELLWWPKESRQLL